MILKEKSMLRFSHSEHVWKTEMEQWKPDMKIVPELTGQKERWSWDNCTFSACNEDEDKIRIFVRSSDKIQIKTGKHENSESTVNFLYDFIVKTIPKTIDIEEFQIQDNSCQHKQKISGKRRVLKLKKELDNDICEIWEWVDDSKGDLGKIHDLLKKISNRLEDENEQNVETTVDTLPSHTELAGSLFPIIYQPAIDTTKNYLRQVHIHPVKGKENNFEITLVFNNEVLRRFGLFNDAYEDFRKVIHGRKKDVETFHIILKNSEPKEFKFQGIHCGEYDIRYDTTHGDKKKSWQFWKKIERPIEFYYANTRHPKIFINTSNHALGEKDNNPHLWKWEYVTWGNDLPIGVSDKSRVEVEKELVPDTKFERIFKLVKKQLS